MNQSKKNQGLLPNRIKNRYFRIYNYAEKSPFLSSVRRGFTLLIPVFMIGSFAVLLMNIPIAPLNAWLNGSTVDGVFVPGILNGYVRSFLLVIHHATLGFSALYTVVSVTYNYSQTLHRDTTLNLLAAFTAICGYIALLGIRPTLDPGGEYYLISEFGVINIFPALIVSFVVSKGYYALYKALSGGHIKSDDFFKSSVKTILPMVILTAWFTVIALVIYRFTKMSLMALLADSLTRLFVGMGRGSAPLAIFVQTFLWFLGMHGSNAIDGVNQSVFAYAEGEILTKNFFDTYVNMGGCGTTICLLIALLIFSKSKKQRQLCKQSALPMVFNINEIMIFGMPVVLNPVYLLPFLLTPLVLLGNSFLFVKLGVFPNVTDSQFMWTTPVILGGYNATGSWMGSLLQIINIVIGVLVYAPFVILDSKLQAMRNENIVEEMTQLVKDADTSGSALNLFESDSDIVSAAKEMAHELRVALKNNAIEMFYQPHVDANGKAISCEALLRWKYKYNKYLYPPLVIHIAKLDNSFDLLTEYVIENAISATIELNDTLQMPFDVFVNIQAQQFANVEFMERLVQKTKSYGLAPYTFGIEITEETALIQNPYEQQIFAMLKENSIKIAIDDFSMGSTSLQYLFNNKFDFVKLDGSLTKFMVQNERIREIILSICNLGKGLDFDIIAEYVETVQQRDLLLSMGCNIYQGYLFSPAIPLKKLIEYVKDLNRHDPEQHGASM